MTRPGARAVGAAGGLLARAGYPYSDTDSSSDSASHAHTARRPSAAAFSQKENSRNCVWVDGGLFPCECVC